jgi:AAA family ATP:ADP antiporter
MRPSPCLFHAAFCEDLLKTMGVRWAGPIAILRNWTFCLFYVMAELWGSVVVSVLFWGFANQITTVEEASQFYPLFGLGANVALIFSGQAVLYFSMVRRSALRVRGATAGWGGGEGIAQGPARSCDALRATPKPPTAGGLR